MKNNKQIKLTVSIGIPAYNEEQNIRNLLLSVCNQNGNNMEIKEIIILSDGSKDKTVQLAKSVNDRRIKVIEYTKRKGKPTVLNRLFKIFKGDVLVIIDADLILNDELTIEKLTSIFHNDKTVGIVTGGTKPLPAKKFLEGAINNYISARNALFDKYSIQDSAYAARGFIAYSRKFLNNFVLPEEILNDDAYSWFYCSRSNYKVHHEREATIWYRSAQSVEDHINQSTRHLTGGVQLYKYFGKEIIDKGFRLPKMALIKIMLYQLLRNPIGYVFLKALNIYCHFRSKSLMDKIDNKWDVITTSKNLAIN